MSKKTAIGLTAIPTLIAWVFGFGVSMSTPSDNNLKKVLESTAIGIVPAVPTAWFLWEVIFKPDTVYGYRDRAKDILRGDSCSNLELLKIICAYLDNPKDAQQKVVSLFIGANELIKALNSLESLHKECLEAKQNLEIALKGLSGSAANEANQMKEQCVKRIQTMRDIARLIKKRPEYEKQFQDGLKLQLSDLKRQEMEEKNPRKRREKKSKQRGC